MNYTQDQINNIVTEARTAAFQAADKFFKDQLGGQDRYPCGFAWVDIFGVKGNTKLGKMLATAGVRKNSYEKTLKIWNPSQYPCQNVDTLEIGAQAAAQVFKKYGFTAYSCSRLD